jgi:hypothetical protein
MLTCRASAETNSQTVLFRPEEFLEEAGLTREWTLEAFKARLKTVAREQRVLLGAVKQHGGCIKFKLLGTIGDRATPQERVLSVVRTLVAKTGYRVHPRIWFAPTRCEMSVMIWVVPEWRPGR